MFIRSGRLNVIAATGPSVSFSSSSVVVSLSSGGTEPAFDHTLPVAGDPVSPSSDVVVIGAVPSGRLGWWLCRCRGYGPVAGHHDQPRLSTGDTIPRIVANTLTNRAHPVVVDVPTPLWAWPAR